MVRLPSPGGDDGVWGGILNDYLSVAHDSSGGIKLDALPLDVDASLAANSDTKIATQKAIKAYVDASALNDASLVHLADAETITGVKTFDAGAFIDKGSQVFDVKAFGATGDGVTDDTAAIQAAINAANAAGGGTVFFSPASVSYILKDEITVYPEVQIVGSGMAALVDASTMVVPSFLKAAFKSTDDVGKSDFVFKDLALKGFFTHGTGSTFAATPAVIGIVVNNARRVFVDNCYFEGFWNAGTFGISSTTFDDSVGTQNLKELKITNNYCYRVLGGLQTYSCENVSWIGNHFYQVADDACAFLGGNSGLGSDAANAVCIGNVFEDGRYLNDNGVPGVGVFMKVDGGGSVDSIYNVLVADNVVKNAYIGIYCGGVTNLAVENNIVETCYESGIYLAGSFAQARVRNNSVKHANTHGVGGHASILAVGGVDLSITDNDILGQNASESGVVAQAGGENVRIEQNQFRSVGLNHIYVNVSNVRISGNHSIGSSNTTSFITVDSCTNSVVISNNTGTGITTGSAMQINNAITTDVYANEYNAVKYGVSVANNSSSPVQSLRLINNKITNATGSTTDGQALIALTLNSSSASKYVELSNNSLIANDPSYYLGCNITGTAAIAMLKIVGNVVRANKYGISVNLSATVGTAYYIGNDIAENSGYNLNEFSTTYTSKNVVSYDADLIHTTGDESMSGNKTFTGAAVHTIANGGNVVAVGVTQNDTTNNPNTVDVTNNGTGIGLNVVQNSSGSSIKSVWKGSSDNSTYGHYFMTSGAAAFTGDGSVMRVDAVNSTDTGRAFVIGHSGTNVSSSVASINKSGSGTGTVFDLNNAGTGVALNISNSSTGAGATIQGDVKLTTAGNGLYVKEGANATMGTATLSSGTATVSTTKVTDNSRVYLTIQSLGTVSAPQPVGVTARSAGTSFTITSADNTDTSVIAWQIVEPA